MKIRKYILSACVGLAAVVGIAYGVGTSMKKKVQPVEVAPVTGMNQADYMGMMDTSTLYGNIISKDTQSVTLDTSHTVKAVYVEAGDKVKKGDSLMTYDMELDRLKREAEDLTRQGLELQLKTLKADLQTMESGKFPKGYGEGDSTGYTSPDTADDTAYADSDDEDDAVDDEDYDGTMSADITPENMDKTGSSVLQDDQASDSVQEDAGQSSSSDEVEDVPRQVITDGSSSSQGQVIIDGSGEEENGDLQDDQTVDGGGDIIEPDEETLTYVNTFLTDVNKLTAIANDGFDNLSSDEAAAIFTEAFNIYRSQLSETGETTLTDFFGQSRTVTVYQVSGMVRAMTGDPTADVLEDAYERLCVYQFINAVRQIYPGQTGPSDDYDYDSVNAVSYAVSAAADAFYDLPPAAVSMDESGNIVFPSEFSALNDPAFGNQNYGQYLQGLIHTLNSAAGTIFPDAASDQTEPDIPDPDFPDDDGGDDGGDDSAGDLQEAIKQQKKDIVNCELDIREAKLNIKSYDRTLENETVKATMDGIVRQAGTTTEQPSSGGFIVVTGKAGMYVQGSLSERSLDTLKVGDTISGSTWSGSVFLATITEISPYPSESTGYDYFSYDPTGDQSSSKYPFLAYVEDAEDLTAGDGVSLSLDGSMESGGLMLYPYMVRTDDSGKSYCYVRGDDGNLEKRYVKTQDTGFDVLRILAGLRASDYIAFPYGDNVKEGAPTKEVDTLSADGGGYYG